MSKVSEHGPTDSFRPAVANGDRGDIVIIGAGLAGLFTALRLTPHPVTVVAADGEDGEAHPFRLDVVQIDIDEDGDPVTSCVVVPDENAEDAVRRVKLPSGGNQRIVWDGLQDMFKAAGERRPAGVPEELPIGRPVLRLEYAIAKLRSRLAVESDRQTERTRQAITGLVTRGLLILR